MTSRAGSSCPLPRIRRAGSPFARSRSAVIRGGAPLAGGRAGRFSLRFSGWFSLEETGSMPVKPTYPGVYIEEIPSGVRTVTGVATSIAAFVGHFPKGLQNERSEEHTSELQSLMRISYAVFGLQKKNQQHTPNHS